ncbi:MAG: 23S rRNA (pseudouridine(1915)-N(3))-methyltransferase RlmH [Hyphomicrobiales bacterium]|nr:23S rRNA (pseudouridine(1915)-N(3))-methyltransferase RlmH [Hyphomicrobiales bacterium]
MRIDIVAVGRLKAGGVRTLFDLYVDRTGRAGRQLGLTLNTYEVPESRLPQASARKDGEAQALLAKCRNDAIIVALDEGGKSLDSRTFAARVGAWRDEGTDGLAFVIGGADGLGPAVLDRARLVLAFGSMTWPHQLVRAMLAEQLYRATTILSGHPYHRD